MEPNKILVITNVTLLGKGEGGSEGERERVCVGYDVGMPWELNCFCCKYRFIGVSVPVRSSGPYRNDDDVVYLPG